MELDTFNQARADCWRLNCDNSAEVKIVGERDDFETSACEDCASVLVEKGHWRYADE